MDADREAGADAADVEGEQDVAALMGFSSFGRKRKYDDSLIAARPAPGLQSSKEDAPPSLPSKPAPLAGDEASAPSGGDGRQRVWWVGYYDPTSNENPWEVLERRAGLGALGRWLPRGHARQGRGRDAGAAGEAGASGAAEGGE